MNKRLEIQVNGEFLDLNEGTVIELDRDNPVLQFGNQVDGGYTFPFEIRNTDKNARILDFPGLINTEIDQTGWPAVIYDNGIPVFTGRLKIERGSLNLFQQKRTGISCFIITDSGDFFQNIKNLVMRDVELGGDRSFDWDGLTTSTTGFWSHIHAVANAGPGSGYDYAFFPTINKGWPVGDVTPDIQNLTYWDDGQPVTKIMFPEHITGLTVREMNRIVPYPYLKYVITKLFEHIGWTVQGSILSDPDFEKIVLINFRAINWCKVKIISGVVTYTVHDPVVFNLKDHMPDMTIAEFLISLKNRLGWWYDFDASAKVCTIKNMRDILLTDVKQYDDKTAPDVTKTVLSSQIKYNLKNGITAFDRTKVNFQGTASKRSVLPTADETHAGEVYFLQAEDAYYICTQDETEAWVWVKASDNNFDFIQDGATEDITTSSQIPIMEDIHMGGTIFVCQCPRIDAAGFWEDREDNEESWGLNLCFYHGPVFNIDASGKYPYGSPHTYDVNFNDVGNWALDYKFVKGFTEVGVYDQFWKVFLDNISTREQFELTLHLSFLEAMELTDESILIIRGVRMLIKTRKQQYPYNGTVSLICIRI